MVTALLQSPRCQDGRGLAGGNWMVRNSEWGRWFLRDVLGPDDEAQNPCARAAHATGPAERRLVLVIFELGRSHGAVETRWSDVGRIQAALHWGGSQRSDEGRRARNRRVPAKNEGHIQICWLASLVKSETTPTVENIPRLMLYFRIFPILMLLFPKVQLES